MRSLLIPFALAITPAFADGPTGLLNDTGQTQCWNGSALVACDDSSTGDLSTYPRQDGRFGRDAAAAKGALTKIGGGLRMTVSEG